jgi:hypothetical protein
VEEHVFAAVLGDETKSLVGQLLDCTGHLMVLR